tara:strand:- start:91 stop:519 length:429 start_codon:yes stop_codon:yes gene_type:complete
MMKKSAREAWGCPSRRYEGYCSRVCAIEVEGSPYPEPGKYFLCSSGISIEITEPGSFVWGQPAPKKTLRFLTKDADVLLGSYPLYDSSCQCEKCKLDYPWPEPTEAELAEMKQQGEEHHDGLAMLWEDAEAKKIKAEECDDE